MEEQKCITCGSKWSSDVAISRCPFCGSDMSKNRSESFNTIEEVFSSIFQKFGIEIVNNEKKFFSLLSDYAPTLETERRLIKVALEANTYKNIIEIYFDSDIENDANIQKEISKLENQYFLNNDWAKKVVYWLTDYLDLHLSKNADKKTTSNKEEKNNFKFNMKEFENYASDEDYVKALKEISHNNYKTAINLLEKAYANGNTLAGVKLAILIHCGYKQNVSKKKAYEIFDEESNKGNPLAIAWKSEYLQSGFVSMRDKENAKKLFFECLDDLKTMCDFGDADAQCFLGFEYLFGVNLEKDIEKGFNLLNKSYSSNGVDAGVHLAVCYLKGIGCKQNIEKGMELLEYYGKEVPSSKARFELGKLYYFGKYVEKNYKDAVLYFLVASDLGNRVAQDYLGDCYYFGRGVEKDYKEAIKWYQRASEQGNIHATKQLGMMYDLGEGTNRNIDKSFYYTKLAADNGDSLAKWLLSLKYLDDGKYNDYTKGKELLIQSAKEGVVIAQTKLGEFYLFGEEPFSKNENKAYEWLEKAATNGNELAKYYLSTIMLSDGIYQNYDLGRKYLTQSAEGDIANAQYILSMYLMTGLYGFKEDDNKALMFAKKAAGQGHKEAERLVGEMYAYIFNDIDKSVNWLENAGENGNISAYLALTNLFWSDEATKKDFLKANKYLGCAYTLFKKNPLGVDDSDIQELKELAEKVKE